MNKLAPNAHLLTEPHPKGSPVLMAFASGKGKAWVGCSLATKEDLDALKKTFADIDAKIHTPIGKISYQTAVATWKGTCSKNDRMFNRYAIPLIFLAVASERFKATRKKFEDQHTIFEIEMATWRNQLEEGQFYKYDQIYWKEPDGKEMHYGYWPSHATLNYFMWLREHKDWHDKAVEMYERNQPKKGRRK